MAAIFKMLGKSRRTLSNQPPGRKRLQRKTKSGKEDGIVQSEVPIRNSTPKIPSLKIDEVLAPDFFDSCLDLVFKSAEDLSLGDKETLVAQDPALKELLHKKSMLSDDSASFYSMDEMAYSSIKRTRAKTPVFMIGQLERIHEQNWQDKAKALAEEYQSTLPPRVFTPRPSTRSPRRLRKIKCQVSLRDLMKDQAELPESPSTEYSEGETLIGSEPTSPWRKSISSSERTMSQLIEDDQLDQSNVRDAKPELNNDIGMKICTDLLTKELASALSQHDKIEINDRASELQILLMIEAYEMVQKQIQEKKSYLDVPADHVSSFELLLDHWLGVLYTVYDRSQEKVRHEKLMMPEWTCKSPLPIRISTEYART